MKFKTLFGIDESQVKKTCLLMPLVRKDILKRLGISNLSGGKLYSAANSKHFTLIHTGMAPAFLGDAVLYLGGTACRNIILFGSCGLVEESEDLNIGSLVIPEKSYSMESFTDMLMEQKKEPEAFFPDKTLVEKFPRIKKVTCATLGSLKLEEDRVGVFKQNGIQVVDMESSALFSAAGHTNRRAMALFYITDIINKKPFYKKLDDRDRTTLLSSIKSASSILCEFIEKNLRD